MTIYSAPHDVDTAFRAAPIVPSDTAPLPNGRCRAVWVNVDTTGFVYVCYNSGISR